MVTRDDLCHHVTARWAELGTLDTAVIRKVGYKKIFADNLSVFIATSCSSPSPPSQSITRCGPEFGEIRGWSNNREYYTARSIHHIHFSLGFTQITLDTFIVYLQFTQCPNKSVREKLSRGRQTLMKKCFPSHKHQVYSGERRTIVTIHDT